ncbi:hypothetical protein CK203_094586 [Vitis vinifera]|uniref:Uncharacterized protein n=1 Tax=Vitis vinifera TaxID=29760 RepID=A0A438CJM7_VITVI|nr:hypothetical protein CK203_094586 [Vitis vinifera]
MARDHSAWLGTTGLLIEIDLGSRAWIGLEIDWLEDQIHQPLAEITDTMASLRDAILGLGLHSSTTTPPPVQSAPQAGAFVLHGQTETTPHSVVAPHRLLMTQALAALPVEFRMPDIERYTGIGCPRIHLQELEALRQGPDESVTSFISRWREKIAQIIDRPSERDQISMIMRSLQPRFARHLMGFPQTDFGSLVQALYGIEEGISRGLWADSSLQTQRGRSRDQAPGPQIMIGTDQLLPLGHRAYLSTPTTKPVYATQAPQRPPMQFHHQYRAPPPPRPVRQFTQLGMPLSRAFQRLRAGHDTDSCSALRHAIQDLIDQGLVDLGRGWDEIFMMGWDGEAPHRSVYMRSQILLDIYLDSRSPGHSRNIGPLRDVQIVTRSGRVAQPPPVDRPFAGIAARGGRRVPSVLGQRLCPERLSIGYCYCTWVFTDFGPSTQTVRAYDGTQRTVMGTLSTHVMIGPVSYSIVFQVLRIQSSFNLLLGRPWIHEAVLYHLPSSEGCQLRGWQRDMVPMSLTSTAALWDRVRARMSGIPFDYPLRPYTFQLADYFIRGSEHTPCTEGTVRIPETVEIQDIQQALGQIIWTPGLLTPGAMIVRPHHQTELAVSSMQPTRAPYCFRYVRSFVLETDEDDSIPDAYTDDMDFIGIGRILDVAPHGPLSAFDILEFSYLMMSQSLMSLLLILLLLREASDSVDPPLSLTLCPAPTTHIYDVDDVGDTDDPLGDQPREIRIGSSLSPDERSRLIDLLQVKEEIRKQLSVGFLSVVEYPEWLANVVPVPKKDGKVRVCVDFRDLNKASPKDDFPLHTLICWLIALQGIRCCPSWMVFLGATYQRAATTLFHDMMHTDVEFRLRLNPKKCTFGVASGKLLGHIVSERGIEIDPEKIRAILDMPAPRTEKEIRGFLGRL